MNRQIKINVSDRDGWQKEYLFPKNIVHIGSGPRSDLVLEPGRGAGVAHLHAQLIVSASDSGCQLVNLGDTDILIAVGPSDDQALPPRSVTDLVNGTVFKLGDFTLTFYGDGDGDAYDSSIRPSEHIGLNISLPQTRLAANQSLDGAVTVSNLGDQTGVQFALELEGLEHDCYSIEPGPLLSAGADRDVSFHIYHRGNKPLAGDRRITIRAAAPQAYPGEQATVSRVVQILPFYRHKLQFVLPAEVAPPLPVEEAPKTETPTPPVERAPRVESALPSWEEDWEAPPVEEAAPPPPAAAKPVPQVEAAAPLREEVEEEIPEPMPEAEAVPPLPVEEQQPEIVTPSPVAEEEFPEIKTAAPLEEEQTPQVEEQEEQVPVEAAAPAPEEPEALAPEISPPPEAEAVPAPPTEAEPPPVAEDWWSAEARISPEKEAEEQRVLKLKASPPPEAKAEPAPPVEAGPPPAVEDEWWSEVEAGPAEQIEEQQVLKLKASPPPEAEPVPVEASPSPATEDWWSPEAKDGEEPIEEQ
jgi:hypothetical protein